MKASGLFNELNTADLAVYLTAILMFAFVGIVDVKKGIIPDICVLIIAAAGLLGIAVGNVSLSDAAEGLCVGLGFFWILKKATKSVGGGDVKLMGAVGLIAGLKGTLFVIFFSFVSGALICLCLMLSGMKSLKDSIPFGIFISAASILYMICGEQIINGYFAVLGGGV